MCSFYSLEYQKEVNMLWKYHQQHVILPHTSQVEGHRLKSWFSYNRQLFIVVITQAEKYVDPILGWTFPPLPPLWELL